MQEHSATKNLRGTQILFRIRKMPIDNGRGFGQVLRHANLTLSCSHANSDWCPQVAFLVTTCSLFSPHHRLLIPSPSSRNNPHSDRHTTLALRPNPGLAGMFSARGSRAPRGSGRGSGRGNAHPSLSWSSVRGNVYHLLDNSRTLVEVGQLSTSAKRRMRRNRQDQWWAQCPSQSARTPVQTNIIVHARPMLPIAPIPIRSPAGSWARMVAVAPLQVQFRPVVPRPLLQMAVLAPSLETPSAAWTESRVLTPSANWDIPSHTETRPTPRFHRRDPIATLERTWAFQDYPPPKLDTWGYPGPSSSTPVPTSHLRTPNSIDLLAAPDPTNLVANALHASLLLSTFARFSPPPINAVTPAQQTLLTTALGSLLAITRQLRICADDHLDPLPVADDVALRPDSGCVVCYTRVADMVLMPCWHLTLCEVGITVWR